MSSAVRHPIGAPAISRAPCHHGSASAVSKVPRNPESGPGISIASRQFVGESAISGACRHPMDASTVLHAPHI